MINIISVRGKVKITSLIINSTDISKSAITCEAEEKNEFKIKNCNGKKNWT